MESRAPRAEPRQPEEPGGFRPPERSAGFGARPRPAPGGFRPGPRPGGDPPPPHSVRLQDGDRVVELSGSPVFIRQVLDDLPAILARLRGEPSPQPASIRMPRPPSHDEVPPTDRTEAIE